MNQELLDESVLLLAEGFCVLPCIAKDKHPKYEWKQFQKEMPTNNDLVGYFKSSAINAIFFVTGAISGNLEFIDFDNKGELFEAWGNKVKENSIDLFYRLVIESTQNGGIHVAYRCETKVSGNLKLASKVVGVDENGKDIKKTLIETRGEGGLILVAPSQGYDFIQGNYFKISVITEEERGFLIKCAFDLDQEKIIMQEKIEKEMVKINGKVYAISPEDAYNEYGDFDNMLKTHGWVYHSKAEDVDRWTRPNKNVADGVSATVKGCVFYCFSSNASPFEPNKSYTKAQVYCLLEHGGDDEACRKELIKLNYGKSLVDVRIEKVLQTVGVFDLTQEAKEEAEKKKNDARLIPLHLLDVGGFIGSVADYSYRCSPVPNKVISFVGALALQSYLIGRKVKGISDIRSNLYLLGLGFSSSGKDFPRKVNTEILKTIGKLEELGDSFASAEGLEDALFRNPCLLFQTDEIDGMLESIKIGREARYGMLMAMLMKTYSSSSSTMPMRRKAGQEIVFNINQPSLTLFGTAVPTYYYEAIGEKMFNNGFFGRMLVFEGYPKEKFKTKKIEKIPQEILDVAQYWRNFSTTVGNISDVIACEPHQIPYTEECVRLIDEFGEKVYQIQKDYEKQKNNGALTVWGRSIENVLKLSLIRACSDSPYMPGVEAKHIKWAIELIEFLISNMMASLEKVSGEEITMKNAKKLEDFLKGSTVGFMSRSHLKKKSKFSMRTFDDAISELIIDGKVEVKTTESSGRPGLIYVLR
jgi:hypothetical protein